MSACLLAWLCFGAISYGMYIYQEKTACLWIMAFSWGLGIWVGW